MGAYFMATIVTNDQPVMYGTHSRDNGLKLMEHSYIDNNYCMHIMSLLSFNPKPLVWLCDYHEAGENTDLVWDMCTENNGSDSIDSFPNNKYYILNHTKKVYIDVEKLISLYKKENNSSWTIHPIPILCNSDSHSQGGGDFHPEDSRRATWCEDIIETTDELPKPDTLFKDVTEDCLFFEG